MQIPIRDQIRAAIEVTRAVADCVRELGSVPAGHLYARLMGKLSHDQFEQIISTLVEARLVRRHDSHLLEWIGPVAGSASGAVETHKQEEIQMTAKIKDGADAKSIRQKLNPPRGATHYQFTVPGKKAVVHTVKDLDLIAGVEGSIEFGKAVFEGRGRHAKLVGFTPIESIKPDEAKAEKPTKARAEKAPSAPGSKGRKPLVMGHSACAVAKALGAAGVKWEEADRIFRAQGVEMPKASLSVQLGFGRNPATYEKRGEPAPLTEAQIAELRTAAA